MKISKNKSRAVYRVWEVVKLFFLNNNIYNSPEFKEDKHRWEKHHQTSYTTPKANENGGL